MSQFDLGNFPDRQLDQGDHVEERRCVLGHAAVQPPRREHYRLLPIPGAGLHRQGHQGHHRGDIFRLRLGWLPDLPLLITR